MSNFDRIRKLHDKIDDLRRDLDHDRQNLYALDGKFRAVLEYLNLSISNSSFTVKQKENKK